MNRRDFFRRGIVGGVAAAAAVREWPFRVFSFPSVIEPATQISAIRFVKCFDIFEARMVNRFDVLYGFGKLKLELPRAIESAEQLVGTANSFLKPHEVQEFIDARIRQFALDPSMTGKEIFAHLPKYETEATIFGFDMAPSSR